MNPVTLQISLSPGDYRHAVHLLPHQIGVWRSQVSEILLSVDMHRSPGRFSQRWAEGEPHILPLARSIEGARVVTVDYSPSAKSRVSAEFFGGNPVPVKDHRGGPFYSYFFGLAEAQHAYVLHCDSDMFFGGLSSTWLAEAVAFLRATPETLLVAPLSGPPHPQGPRHLKAEPAAGASQAFWFNVMSSRLFLIDRQRFRERIGALAPRRPPSLRANLIAVLEGNPRADLPEHLVTTAMHRAQLRRYEFLGASPGMWSLHPPYRNETFYRTLPDLIRRIECGDVPIAQFGDHDLNDSMIDWSDARAALRRNRIWQRLGARWLARLPLRRRK